MPEFVTMFVDDDELPRAAAAAAKPQAAPLWPPVNNSDLATWPPAPPWPANKAATAEQRVAEKQNLYVQDSETDLEKKRELFLKELREGAGRMNGLCNGGPFTYRENAWIQLEAIRRVWVDRKAGAARFTSASIPQSKGGGGWGAGASAMQQLGMYGSSARGYTVPAPRPQSRGANQQLQAAAVGKPGGKGGLNLVTTNNAARAPMPFGSLNVEQAKQQQQQQQQGRSTQVAISHHFAPNREGKSGGGGRPDGGEFDGFRHTPGRNPAGNQQNPAPKSGGAGRTRSKKKPPPECEGCNKGSLTLRFFEPAQQYLCNSCRRELDPDDSKPQRDDDDDFVQNKKAPAAEPAQRKGKRKAQEPEVVDLLSEDEDEETQLKRALQASKTEAAAKRPQRKAAQEGQSLSTRLAGLKAFYPSPADPEAVEVSAKDLSYLELGEFLNDSVIDMYLLKIKAAMPEDQRRRCHFFNTFFYKKLTEKDNGGQAAAGKEPQTVDDRAYDRVKRWTKNIDLFAKDFIVVPIHKELHWSLAIICHPGVEKPQSQAPDETVDLTEPTLPCPVQSPLCPVILHLDSMVHGHQTNEVGKKLRAYLHREWGSREAKAAAGMARPAPLPDVGGGGVPALALAPALAPAPAPAAAPCTAVADAAAGAAMGFPVAAPSAAAALGARPVQSPSVFPAPHLPQRDFSKIECFRLGLPQQDNTTDCGCFLLAYVEHFAGALADLVPGITGAMLQELKRKKPATPGIQLAEGKTPFFLGKQWFPHGWGSHMRLRLRLEALNVLVEQGPKPGAAAAAGDAGAAAGPSGAAAPGQVTDVVLLAPQDGDLRMNIAAEELKRGRDQAELVEATLAREAREAIARWLKKLEGGEAVELVDADVAAGGGKGGRGKAKAACKLPVVTLEGSSDVEEEDDELPPGITSRGKAGAGGKHTTHAEQPPVRPSRVKSGAAAAAAAPRPGDADDAIHIPDDGDDDVVQKGQKRSKRLEGKPRVNMVDPPYNSDEDDDQPVVETKMKSHKRLRNRSGSGGGGAQEEEVVFVDKEEPAWGSGGRQAPKAPRGGKTGSRRNVIDDDDDDEVQDASAFRIAPNAVPEGSLYLMQPSAPVPGSLEEPQAAHTPPVDSKPAGEDEEGPPGFGAAPGPDVLDLTGEEEDQGERIAMVPNGPAGRAATNRKMQPSSGGVKHKKAS